MEIKKTCKNKQQNSQKKMQGTFFTRLKTCVANIYVDLKILKCFYIWNKADKLFAAYQNKTQRTLKCEGFFQAKSLTRFITAPSFILPSTHSISKEQSGV